MVLRALPCEVVNPLLIILLRNIFLDHKTLDFSQFPRDLPQLLLSILIAMCLFLYYLIFILQKDDIIAESLDFLVEVGDANFILFDGGLIKLCLPLY